MNKIIKFIFIALNNFMLKLHLKNVSPNKMLILLPRCLQYSKCNKNVVESYTNCVACGQCPVGSITTLAKKYNMPVCLATGSLMAKECVKKHRPKLILAVACERELLQGLIAVFPLPVYALCNERPNGPCINTQVDVEVLESAIERFKKWD